MPPIFAIFIFLKYFFYLANFLLFSKFCYLNYFTEHFFKKNIISGSKSITISKIFVLSCQTVLLTVISVSFLSVMDGGSFFYNQTK